MKIYKRKPLKVRAERWEPGVVIEGVIEYAASESRVPWFWLDEDRHSYPCKEGFDAFLKITRGQYYPLSFQHLNVGDWVVTDAAGSRVMSAASFQEEYEIDDQDGDSLPAMGADSVAESSRPRK